MPNDQEPDIYGQVHPVETPELIDTKLVEFEAEVEKIPLEQKPSLKRAEEKCPELLTDVFKLKFLRCEVFNADLAAQRYVRYWENMVKVFGDDKAFLPLTLDGAVKDEAVALNMGYVQLLNGKDPMGRSILFVDPSNQDRKRADAYSMTRAAAYFMDTALQNEAAQKYGVVIVIYPAKAELSQFNGEQSRLMTSAMKGSAPVRLSGIHVCHPPAFLRIVLPILQLFLGPRLRKRIRFHTGSEESVLSSLSKYGLTKDILPSELGGDVVLNLEAWLEARRREGK